MKKATTTIPANYSGVIYKAILDGELARIEIDMYADASDVDGLQWFYTYGEASKAVRGYLRAKINAYKQVLKVMNFEAKQLKN